jgi:DNA-binding beta-propeller fold protein YncE
MEKTRKSLRNVWIASLALCAGCAAGQTQSGLAPAAPSGFDLATRVHIPMGAPQPYHRGGGWLSPAAKTAKQLIYASDFTGNAIEIYSAKGSDQKPIGEITDGISGPQGCFVDKRGDLFVTNASNQTVTMYKKGSTSYSLQYTGFAYPTNVTVDKKGTVYVDDLVGEKVVEFPKGSTRSKLTIDLSYPQGVAIDSKDNLYIEYNTGAHGEGPGDVNEYAPGGSTGENLDLPIVWAAGDAIDGKNDIVTADQGSGTGNDAVYVFPQGSDKPSETITQGMEDPFRLAFDKPFKYLYVADAEVNAVLVYSYPAGKLVNEITSGLSSVDGVAVYPEGN